MRAPGGELIAAKHAVWGGSTVEPAIFGTTDPAEIARAVDRLCRRVARANVVRYRFFTASIGSVHGLELSDGRCVVVKAHQRDVSPRYLTAVLEIQRRLCRGGFPAPRPIGGPYPLGRGHATIEQCLLAGSRHDGHDPRYRRAMAQGLADLVERCRGFAPEFRFRGASLHVGRRRGLWPRPHSRLFDFEATARGAGWIDRFAERSLRLLHEHPRAGAVVLGHGDWRAGNLRFDARRRRIVAVYDWDSLARAREPVLVGAVAHAFSADWDRPGPLAPTLDELRSFVAEYEAARGGPFTIRERRALAASLTYATAYTARCTHAVDPATREYPDGDFRGSLRRHGRDLLAI